MNYAQDVSQFFNDTCQGKRPFDGILFGPYAGMSSLPAVHPVDEAHTTIVPLTTGSRAEFYIVPMLSCMGDVDVMFYYTREMASPAGYPVPCPIPAEFDRNVRVYEISDSPFPGYVYLELSYLLTKCESDASYRVMSYQSRQQPLSHDWYVKGANVHGPARMYQLETGLLGMAGAETAAHVDSVKCLHCLVWPPQAADWRTRQRKHGWPDQAKVDYIVSKGCDVVAVAHRLCKKDEWMSKHQWRLSFSRAEVILLNSWTPTQQSVYHMLRVFVKTEELTADSTGNVLSNYNIKTLMLWACETKSQSWWTDTNLVAICVYLLHCLGNWVSEARCKHYFIGNCNLAAHFPGSPESQRVASVLLSTREDDLARWFVFNYIRKCARLCPDNLDLKFDSMHTKAQLTNVMCSVKMWKEHVTFRDFVKDADTHVLVLNSLADGVSGECTGHMFTGVVEKNAVQLLQFFQKDNKSLRQGASSWASGMINTFFAVSRIARQFKWFDLFVDFIAYSDPQLNRVCFSSTESFQSAVCSPKSSARSMKKAAALMKVASNKQISPNELLFTNQAKMYLHLALKYSDPLRDPTYCLSNVYLTALYYATGEHQIAIDHCTLATIPQRRCKRTPMLIHGELLQKIDDNIDIALGLAVLYNYVRTAAFDPKHEGCHVCVFRPELFAHYVTIKHLLPAKCSRAPKTLVDSTAQSVDVHLLKELQMYKDFLMLKNRFFATDLLLLKLPPNDPPSLSSDALVSQGNSPKSSPLVHLVRSTSIKRLMSLKRLQDQNTCSTLLSFEPLYLYRCCLYDRCIELCQTLISEQIDTVGDSSISRIVGLHSILYSDYLEIMDSDAVSVMGLVLLVNPAIVHALTTVRISELHLSLHLMTRCHYKLEHSTESLQYTLDLINVFCHLPAGLFDRALLQLSRTKIVRSVALKTGKLKRSPTEAELRTPDQCISRYHAPSGSDTFLSSATSDLIQLLTPSRTPSSTNRSAHNRAESRGSPSKDSLPTEVIRTFSELCHGLVGLSHPLLAAPSFQRIAEHLLQNKRASPCRIS